MKTGTAPRPASLETGPERNPNPPSVEHHVHHVHHGDQPAGAPARSWPAAALIGLFRVYQVARSGRVSPCRFTPTCSQYAIEAVARHGAGRGLRLALRRLGRCRPGGPSGYDPIPE